MAGDWTTRPLADCGRWLSGGTPSKATSDYWVGDIPWVSPKDMSQRFIYDAEDHLSLHGVANGSRLVPRDTILIVVRSMTLANRVQIAVTEREVAFNQDLKAIRCRGDVDPHFLFYSLLSRSDEILGLVDEASHGTKRLGTQALGSLAIRLPSLPEQRSIAAIAKAIDDKIELNRRIYRAAGQASIFPCPPSIRTTHRIDWLRSVDSQECTLELHPRGTNSGCPFRLFGPARGWSGLSCGIARKDRGVAGSRTVAPCYPGGVS